MESTEKPIVLVFTDWYLPGYRAGGPIVSIANLVEALGDALEFRIVCSDRDYLQSLPYENIDNQDWNKVGKAWVSYMPPHLQKQKTYEKLFREFPNAQIYISGIFSKAFSILPLLAANGLGKTTIISPRGMLAPGALGIKPTKKKIFLALAKGLKYYHNTTFHATGAEEAFQIKSTIGSKNALQTIPNIPRLPSQRHTRNEKQKGQLRIVNVARIAKEKNTLFALECLKLLPSGIKVDARFIGPIYDETYFRQCQIVAHELPEGIKVEFLGALHPGKMDEFYAKADIFFLPTLGENYGHAIVEALLAGTAVLVSDLSPWKNLEADGLGADLSLEHPQAFADFLFKIANMDESAYQENFGRVREKITGRIQLAENVAAYKSLLG